MKIRTHEMLLADFLSNRKDHGDMEGGGGGDEREDLTDGRVGGERYSDCGVQRAAIRYPLLLAADERLEAGGDGEAQLVEERGL